MFENVIRKYKFDILVILFLLLSLPLFFYKLGQSSLVSWDEAWYAEIGRNILNSGEFFQLKWNGAPYIDHPPVGFWLIAAGEKIFGENEFGVRFPAAIAGFLSLIITYFLGKELFNRIVGFASAIGLCSALWFLYRARSGNLDVFLAIFFLLTLLLALKSIKKSIFLVPFFLSLALLIMTKSVVPLTILPSLAIIFWGEKRDENFRKYWKLGLWFFSAIILTWVYTEFRYVPDFINRFFKIGLPGVEGKTSYLSNFNLAKEYLHSGVGKWFWPGVVGIFLSLFCVFIGINKSMNWAGLKKSFFVYKRFYVLSALFITFFVPFIFSAKGQIWHLIPLHPIMILAFFGTAYFILDLLWGKFSLVVPGRIRSDKTKEILMGVGLIGISFYLTLNQIKQIWYQFIDIPKYVSDEAILSSEASKYREPFFIEGDFGPAAIWYSKKDVAQIRNDAVGDLFYRKGLDFSNLNSFLMITQKYRLDDLHILDKNYTIIKTDRDKILVKSDHKPYE